MVSPHGSDTPDTRFGSAPQSILVIDDAPADIGMLIATLSEAGYRVRAAPDCESTLEQARSTPPDLILLAAQMSGMDGFEICRQLRQLSRLAQTPVIFMIEQSELQDRVGGFAAGGDDYVTKPFQYQEVLGRVRLHLTHRMLEFEVESLHRHLDKRLAERTAELKAAIAESEALRCQLQQENYALKEEIRRRHKPK